MELGEAGLQCCVQLSACPPQTELATEEWLDHFWNLRQHRGQHSPSGTVALEQGMMGQDTFLQMVTEFCKAGEGEGNMLPSTSLRGAFCGISMISHDSIRAVNALAEWFL